MVIKTGERIFAGTLFECKTGYLISKQKSFSMKKIILALVLVFTLGGSAKLAAQESRVKFYYYPSSNIYYNPSTNQYWYYNTTTTAWLEVKTLPTTIVVTKTPSYTVYYNGEDVWKDNPAHMQKYKVKKNGAAKVKKPKS